MKLTSNKDDKYYLRIVIIDFGESTKVKTNQREESKTRENVSPGYIFPKEKLEINWVFTFEERLKGDVF